LILRSMLCSTARRLSVSPALHSYNHTIRANQLSQNCYRPLTCTIVITDLVFFSPHFIFRGIWNLRGIGCDWVILSAYESNQHDKPKQA
jgi:hypothetical protein